MRRDAPPYVFYEGPPTANGLPGLHHVLARSYKDVFARYKQMTGFSVAAQGRLGHTRSSRRARDRARAEDQRQEADRGVRHRRVQRALQGVGERVHRPVARDERTSRVLARLRPSLSHLRRHLHRVGVVELEGALGRRPALPGLQGHAVLPALPDDTLVTRAEPGIQARTRRIRPSTSSSGSTTRTARRSCSHGRQRRGRSRATSRLRCTPANATCASRRTASRTSSPSSASRSSTATTRSSTRWMARDLVDLTYEPLFTDMLPEGLAFIVLDAPGAGEHG